MLRSTLVALVLVTLACPAHADPPPRIPVQGTLVDDQDQGLEGEVLVTFALYDAPDAAEPLFVEEQLLLVERGFFTAFIGDAQALDLSLFRDVDEAWIGITVEDDVELSPRLPVGTTPWAAVAEQALAVDWANVRDVPEDLLDGDDDTTYTAGTGLSLDIDGTFSADEDWVRGVCLDTGEELRDLLDDVYLGVDYVPDWSEVTGLPSDLLDGDDDTTYAAGTGLTLSGTTFAVDRGTVEGWAQGVCYDTETELTDLLDDNYREATWVPAWSDVTGRPAGLDDGDDDTTYTAGTGLTLSGTRFAVDRGTVEGWARGVAYDSESELTALLDDNYLAASYTPRFSDLTGVPTGLADGDDDTTYTAGDGLTLSGTELSIDSTELLAILKPTLDRLEDRLDAIEEAAFPHPPILDTASGAVASSRFTRSGGAFTYAGGDDAVLLGTRRTLPSTSHSSLAAGTYHLRYENKSSGWAWTLGRVPYTVEGEGSRGPSSETARYYDSRPNSMLLARVVSSGTGSSPTVTPLVNRLQLVTAAADENGYNRGVSFSGFSGCCGSRGEARTATFNRTLNWARTPYVTAAADGVNDDDRINEGTAATSYSVNRYGATLSFRYEAQNSGGPGGTGPFLHTLLIAP